jgi:hypothetical protein
MVSMNWQCPFCGRHTTITQERRSEDHHYISLENKHGRQAIHTLAIACPNEECKELFVAASMGSFAPGPSRHTHGKPHSAWTLRPQGDVKPFPDYVPAPILSDYREACLIRELSPKASATLSRRCLQGMIRDFWKIKKRRLIDEIRALEGRVDAKTWRAIDAVREIGNIGAHMGKDINLLIDVDPREADLLSELIETLIEDWYVERHDRDERMARIVEVATTKKTAKLKAEPPPVTGQDSSQDPQSNP